jgi:hypothetical protein
VYYWLVITCNSTRDLALEIEPTATKYNGVNWAGVPKGLLPSALTTDPSVFTARELRTSLGASDTDFRNQPTSPSAVVFLASASNWSSIPGAAQRLTNWQSLGSNIRYGVQVIADILVKPSASREHSE